MTQTDWIGFIGVALLLIAYFLNLKAKITTKDTSYLLLNVFGAGLACLAAILIDYFPFVILEGTWFLVSGIGLMNLAKKRTQC